jgi:hypothetical protein
MGEPSIHIPVKPIVGLISNSTPLFDAVRRILENKFGEIDHETALLDFACTAYYEKELGQNLKRKFLSFKRLVSLNRNYRTKLYTNRIEKKLSINNARSVNIDPGYVTLTNVVLFTTKNRSHRIYIDRGIYADLELLYVNKSFHPLDWTYPDYRTREYIDFFNNARALYMNQVKRYLCA